MKRVWLVIVGAGLLTAEMLLGASLEGTRRSRSDESLVGILQYGTEDSTKDVAERCVGEFGRFAEALTLSMADVPTREPIPSENKCIMLMALAESEVMTAIPESLGLGSFQDPDPGVRRMCVSGIRASLEATNAIKIIKNTLSLETDPETLAEKERLLAELHDVFGE